MSAEVIDLELWRDVRLTERALAGDVDAAIAWLHSTVNRNSVTRSAG